LFEIYVKIIFYSTARRMEDMSPGEYKSTRNSKQPVVIEGNWQEPTVEEQIKHDTVHKLEVNKQKVQSSCC